MKLLKIISKSCQTRKSGIIVAVPDQTVIINLNDVSSFSCSLFPLMDNEKKQPSGRGYAVIASFLIKGVQQPQSFPITYLLKTNESVTQAMNPFEVINFKIPRQNEADADLHFRLPEFKLPEISASITDVLFDSFTDSDKKLGTFPQTALLNESIEKAFRTILSSYQVQAEIVERQEADNKDQTLF